MEINKRKRNPLYAEHQPSIADYSKTFIEEKHYTITTYGLSKKHHIYPLVSSPIATFLPACYVVWRTTGEVEEGL